MVSILDPITAGARQKPTGPVAGRRMRIGRLNLIPKPSNTACAVRGWPIGNMSTNMSSEQESAHAGPHWFIPPGETDYYAIIAIVIVIAALYGLVVLYATFDRWAEHRAHGTPLAKTIPTMLAIALLYELFPLNHFNILLPLSAILIALMADWSRFHLNFKTDVISVEDPKESEPEQNQSV